MSNPPITRVQATTISARLGSIHSELSGIRHLVLPPITLDAVNAALLAIKTARQAVWVECAGHEQENTG